MPSTISYATDPSSAGNVDTFNKLNGFDIDATKSDSAAADLNFTTFLQLLTTQLQNQDPLDPVDNTEFTAQIAQFSGLEQQITTNELLTQLASGADYSQQTLALSYVGKDALVPGDVTANDGNTDVSLNYTLPYNAYDATIEISDADGEIVRTLEGTKVGGRNEVIWDGLDDEGNPVEKGLFTFNVTAVDVNGDGMLASEYNYAQLVTVAGTGDDTIFTTSDGRTVKMSDIAMVRERSEIANDTSTDVVASYLGKEVLAPDNLVGTDGTTDIELAYTLPQDSIETTITITDVDENVVRTIDGDDLAGLNKVIWDSLDDDGNPVDSGTYQFVVTATNAAGEDLSENVYEYSYGRVTEVQGAGNSASFILADGRVVSKDSAISVREAKL